MKRLLFALALTLPIYAQVPASGTNGLVSWDSITSNGGIFPWASQTFFTTTDRTINVLQITVTFKDGSQVIMTSGRVKRASGWFPRLPDGLASDSGFFFSFMGKWDDISGIDCLEYRVVGSSHI